MPRNVYHEINLHIVWRVKDDLPILRDDIEAQVQKYLVGRAKQEGVLVHAIGGTDDHVHLTVSVPPTLTVSDWIGKLKGSCSHHINFEVTKRTTLEWQTGYGVVSFGAKDLPWVVKYVKDQREHHQPKRVHRRLESTERMDGKPAEAG